MTAEKRASSTYHSAGSVNEQRWQISDVSLQRRAMGSMLLAMLVMALGLPLHLTALNAHGDHAGSWRLMVWLICLLTLWTVWAVRHVLHNTWWALRQGSFGSTELVTICALGAFAASCPAVLNHSAPMYFDVTAMALAWIVAGEAQSAAIQRRFASTLEQLAPLQLQPQIPSLPASIRSDQAVRWLGVAILACAIVALAVQMQLSGSAVIGFLASLAVVAVGCPCTLGIAKSSAWQVGVERAAERGWLIPSGALLNQIAAAPQVASQYAVQIGEADLAALLALARAVQRAMRWNYLWAIGLNLLLLPLALVGPLPAFVPAATMVIARLLIFWTTRTLRLSSSGTIAMMR